MTMPCTAHTTQTVQGDGLASEDEGEAFSANDMAQGLDEVGMSPGVRGW